MIATGLLLIATSTAQAQAAPSYPVIEQLSARLVQKYQTSTCQQLAAERQAPANARKEQMKDRVGQQLQQDAAMRAAFVSRVAGPIVDKMIVCGFIP